MPETTPNNGFYRKTTFDLLMVEIKDLKKGQESLEKKVDALSNKLSGILGWAAGAGAVAGVVFSFIREKLKL